VSTDLISSSIAATRDVRSPEMVTWSDDTSAHRYSA